MGALGEEVGLGLSKGEQLMRSGRGCQSECLDSFPNLQRQRWTVAPVKTAPSTNRCGKRSPLFASPSPKGKNHRPQSSPSVRPRLNGRRHKLHNEWNNAMTRRPSLSACIREGRAPLLGSLQKALYPMPMLI